MTSRILPVGLLAVGCLTGAAGGSYLAFRHNAPQTAAAPADVPGPAAPAGPAVAESEGVVTPTSGSDLQVGREAPLEAPPAIEEAPRPRVTSRPAEARRISPGAVPARQGAVAVSPTTSSAVSQEPSPAAPTASAAAPAGVTDVPAQPVEPLPLSESAGPAQPVFEEIVVPSASVIGLELETTLSSETARLEDRVDARVTRDVYAEGRLAIPAGSRVIGAVTVVERGGKVKERARLGVRFHTLVLAGGRQANLRTEEIYREGESPANDSSRKIGGGAVGGAVLGAILGGKKGVLVGATAGAAGGTAAVMAGDRKPATLTSGTAVTVKLAAPVTVEVER